jgi:hypothetical protein
MERGPPPLAGVTTVLLPSKLKSTSLFLLASLLQFFYPLLGGTNPVNKPVSLDGLMSGLAQLRSNALLAVKTSAGIAVSQADVDRLDAIATGAFGITLRKVESAPLGSAPKPDGPTMGALLERLPHDAAIDAHAFLVDLHTRTHNWLTG